MKYVKVSELKAKLSEHLRRVEAGETVIVLDRKRPVARIVPTDASSSDVRITEPSESVESLRELKPIRVGRRVDVGALLRELRGDR